MEMKAWGKDPIITAGNWSEDNNGSFMDYKTTRSMGCAARVRSRSAEASPCPLICWSIGTEAHVDAATGWRVNHGLYPAREEEWAGGVATHLQTYLAMAACGAQGTYYFLWGDRMVPDC